MASEVGTAYVTLVPSAKGFAQKMQSQLGGDLANAGQQGGATYGNALATEGKRTIGSRAKGMLGGLAKGGALAAAAAGVAVGKVLVDAIGEAREAAQVTARTENVIKSMGNQANISADQVGNLAEALSNKAGVDDEVIQSGANLLLTFGNVRNEAGKGNDIFNQTTGLMVDMAQAMGTDTKGAALQLGKALNDPTKGVSALTRSGVSFTEQQKEQIKALQASGDTLGAQKIILGEVEKQFGGAAEAMATPAARAEVAWGNFKEQIGTYLLPLVDRVLTGFADALPKVIEFGEGLFDALGPVVTKVVPLVQNLWDTLTSGSGGASSTVAWIKQTFGQIVGIVKGVVDAVTVLWQAGWGQHLLTVLKSTFEAIKGVISGALAIIKGVIDVVLGILSGDWSKVWEGIKGIVSGAVTIVVSIVTHLWTTVKSGFTAGGQALLGIFGNVWSGIKDAAGAALGFLVGQIKALPGRLVNGLGNLAGTLGNVISSAWTHAKNLVNDGISTVVNAVTGLPGKLLRLTGEFGSAGKSIIDAFVNGLKNAAGIVSGIAGNVWDAVRGLINGAIDKINNALEFTIDLPGPKNLTVDIANIPHLATGARATGATLAVIGEGSEPETVLPDSVLRGLLERTAADASAGQGAGAPSVRVFIGERELTDIVRVEVDGAQAAQVRQLAYGRRV